MLMKTTLAFLRTAVLHLNDQGGPFQADFIVGALSEINNRVRYLFYLNIMISS